MGEVYRARDTRPGLVQINNHHDRRFDGDAEQVDITDGDGNAKVVAEKQLEKQSSNQRKEESVTSNPNVGVFPAAPGYRITTVDPDDRYSGKGPRALHLGR